MAAADIATIPTKPQHSALRSTAFDDVLFHFARSADAAALSEFFDRTIRDDCFMPLGRIAEMIARRRTHRILLAVEGDRIIGAAIATAGSRLLNLAVSPQRRGRGIGAELVRLLAPTYIRAKTNMSAGDPTPYYEGLGYCAGRLTESDRGNRVVREMRDCRLIATCGQEERCWEIDRPRVTLAYPAGRPPRPELPRDLRRLARAAGVPLEVVRIDAETGEIGSDSDESR